MAAPKRCYHTRQDCSVPEEEDGAGAEAYGHQGDWLPFLFDRAVFPEVIQPEQLGLVVHSMRQLDGLEPRYARVLELTQQRCAAADAHSLASILHDLVMTLPPRLSRLPHPPREGGGVQSLVAGPEVSAVLLVETFHMVQHTLEEVVDDLVPPLALLAAEALMRLLPIELPILSPEEADLPRTSSRGSGSTVLYGTDLVCPSLCVELEARCESITPLLQRPIDFLALLRVGKAALDHNSLYNRVTGRLSTTSETRESQWAEQQQQQQHEGGGGGEGKEMHYASAPAPSAWRTAGWERAVQHAAALAEQQIHAWDKSSLIHLADVLLDLPPYTPGKGTKKSTAPQLERQSVVPLPTQQGGKEGRMALCGTTERILLPLLIALLSEVRQRAERNDLSPSQTLAWMHRLAVLQAMAQPPPPSASGEEEQEELAPLLASLGERIADLCGALAGLFLPPSRRGNSPAHPPSETEEKRKGMPHTGDIKKGRAPAPEGLGAHLALRSQSAACTLFTAMLQTQCAVSREALPPSLPPAAQQCLVAYIHVASALVQQVQAEAARLPTPSLNAAGSSSGAWSHKQWKFLQDVLQPLCGRCPEAALEALAVQYRLLSSHTVVLPPPPLFTALRQTGPDLVQDLVHRFAAALEGACGCWMRQFDLLSPTQRREVLSTILCWRVFHCGNTGAASSQSQQWRTVFCVANLPDAAEGAAVTGSRKLQAACRWAEQTRRDFDVFDLIRLVCDASTFLAPGNGGVVPEFHRPASRGRDLAEDPASAASAAVHTLALSLVQELEDRERQRNPEAARSRDASGSLRKRKLQPHQREREVDLPTEGSAPMESTSIYEAISTTFLVRYLMSLSTLNVRTAAPYFQVLTALKPRIPALSGADVAHVLVIMARRRLHDQYLLVGLLRRLGEGGCREALSPPMKARLVRHLGELPCQKVIKPPAYPGLMPGALFTGREELLSLPPSSLAMCLTGLINLRQFENGMLPWLLEALYEEPPEERASGPEAGLEGVHSPLLLSSLTLAALRLQPQREAAGEGLGQGREKDGQPGSVSIPLPWVTRTVRALTARLPRSRNLFVDLMPLARYGPLVEHYVSDLLPLTGLADCGKEGEHMTTGETRRPAVPPAGDGSVEALATALEELTSTALGLVCDRWADMARATDRRKNTFLYGQISIGLHLLRLRAQLQGLRTAAPDHQGACVQWHDEDAILSQATASLQQLTDQIDLSAVGFHLQHTPLDYAHVLAITLAAMAPIPLLTTENTYASENANQNTFMLPLRQDSEVPVLLDHLTRAAHSLSPNDAVMGWCRLHDHTKRQTSCTLPEGPPGDRGTGSPPLGTTLHRLEDVLRQRLQPSEKRDGNVRRRINAAVLLKLTPMERCLMRWLEAESGIPSYPNSNHSNNNKVQQHQGMVPSASFLPLTLSLSISLCTYIYLSMLYASTPPLFFSFFSPLPHLLRPFFCLVVRPVCSSSSSLKATAGNIEGARDVPQLRLEYPSCPGNSGSNPSYFAFSCALRKLLQTLV
eukprot:gene1535-920_t